MTSRADFRQIADRVTRDLLTALAEEAGTDEPHTTRRGCDPSLRTRSLSVPLGADSGRALRRHGGDVARIPGNPAEILDGMMHLCLQNPSTPVSHSSLRVLDGLKTGEPELVQSMATKVRGLQTAHPLEQSSNYPWTGSTPSLSHEKDPHHRRAERGGEDHLCRSSFFPMKPPARSS